MGTAAVINHHYTISDKTKSALKDHELEIVRELKGHPKSTDFEHDVGHGVNANDGKPRGCKICHISFGKLGIAVAGKMRKCAVCKYDSQDYEIIISEYNQN